VSDLTHQVGLCLPVSLGDDGLTEVRLIAQSGTEFIWIAGVSNWQRSLLILGIVEHPGLKQAQSERAKWGAKGRERKS